MRISKQQIINGARYLLVELLIVFVGVFLAFQLNEYRSEREVDHRRQQLQQALVHEIDIFLLGADQLLPALDSVYSDWLRRYEAGEMPAPLYYEIGGADLPPRGMWQAVLASDGLGTLPVASMQKVSEYYNALEILLEKYAELMEFAEQEIIPYNRMDVFYDVESRRMKRKYELYMQRMQDMVRLFGAVRELARQSKSGLEAGMEA